jgi:hypothetical protein
MATVASALTKKKLIGASRRFPTPLPSIKSPAEHVSRNNLRLAELTDTIIVKRFTGTRILRPAAPERESIADLNGLPQKLQIFVL